MKGKWKILSLIMATILCVAIFAGCGTQENTSSALNEPAVSGAADTTKQIDTMVIGTTMKITSISQVLSMGPKRLVLTLAIRN